MTFRLPRQKKVIGFIILLFLFPPTESKSWQQVLSRGETGRIPETNSFSSYRELSPKSPSWDQLALSSWLIMTILVHCRGRWLYSRKPGGARHCKSVAPHWCQNLSPNSGPAACHLKANTREASVGRKESLLCSGSWQPGEKADSCPKANSPLLSREQELLKGSFRGLQVDGGGYVQNTTVNSDSHL